MMSNNFDRVALVKKEAFANFRDKFCFCNGVKPRSQVKTDVLNHFILYNENIIVELEFVYGRALTFKISKEPLIVAIKFYYDAFQLFKIMEISGKSGIKYAVQFSELIEKQLLQILSFEFVNDTLLKDEFFKFQNDYDTLNIDEFEGMIF